MVSNQSPAWAPQMPGKRQDRDGELLPETLPPTPSEDQQHQGIALFSVLFVKEVLFTQSPHVCGSPDPISRQGLSTRRTGLGTQRDSGEELCPQPEPGHSDLEASTRWRTEGPPHGCGWMTCSPTLQALPRWESLPLWVFTRTFSL